MGQVDISWVRDTLRTQCNRQTFSWEESARPPLAENSAFKLAVQTKSLPAEFPRRELSEKSCVEPEK